MNQMTPLSIGQRPSYLPQADLDRNRAAIAGGSASFPVLSIRGRVWRIRQGGNEEPITASPGPGLAAMAVPAIPVIITSIAVGNAKQYYATGFNENELGRRPDCFSINGKTPDAAAPNKQNATCEGCPQNAWGSAVNSPSGRAKACRDLKRLAVAMIDSGNTELEPMLLVLPPTSRQNLDKYVENLSRHGVGYDQIITSLAFDASKTAPTVTFQPAGWPTPEQYQATVEIGASEIVDRMLVQEFGGDAAPAPAAAPPAPAFQLPPRPAPVAQVAQAPKPAPVAKPVQAPVQAQPVAQAMQPRPRAVAAPVQAQVPVMPAPEEPVEEVATQASVVVGAPVDMQSAIDNLLNAP